MNTPPARNAPFSLRPAPKAGGFRMPGYWVWCGSPICDDAGRVHLFASRWSKEVAFNPHWLTHSEIVHAVAASPEEPFEFQSVVLPPRDEAFWDGRMTHNPSVVRWQGLYLLFYTGTTYSGAAPTPEERLERTGLGKLEGRTDVDPRVREAHRNQRIGVAIADRLEGPWQRFDAPVLTPRAGQDHWDSLMTTNPAPCVTPEGRIYLVYKAVKALGDYLHLGIAAADSPRGPFQRLSDEPIFRFDAQGQHVEDPFLWHDGAGFHAIMKDMNGGLCGVPRGGLYLQSRDGIEWGLSEMAQAYTRHVRWDDGTESTQAFFERPQFLIRDGKPTHLFAATGIGGDSMEEITDSWNMVVPLAAPGEPPQR